MRRRGRWAIAAIVTATVAALAAEGEARALMRQANTRQYAASANGSRRGRPRKFGRPARAVTLTLPEDVIATLQTIDTDLSLAVVRATASLAPPSSFRPAELTTYGNRSVIIVPRSRLLSERTGVELVPLSDGRALISLDDRVSIPQLELRLTDALDDPGLDEESRRLFEELVNILRRARHDRTVEFRQRQIIILHRRRARRVLRPGSPA